MMKATELSKSLQGLNFSSDQVADMVKARIADGSVEDDTSSLNPNQVKELADVIKSTMTPMSEGRTSDINKAGAPNLENVEIATVKEGNEVLIEVGSTFDALAKATNAQNQYLNGLAVIQKAGHTEIGKGILALGQLVEMTANTTASMQKALGGIVAKQAELEARISAPVPPKSQLGQGLKVVPHPSEVQKAGQGSAESEETSITCADIHKALLAERNELIKSVQMSGASGMTNLQQQRMNALGNGITNAESGSLDTALAIANDLGVKVAG